ncbi:IS66 family transposase [Tepidibacter mesophilus]|uniref:IS66 family transposase n=1 Tax=Tepidibacter mesophilus TaxID=655607 RepID=UPI000C0749D8|nr:IS66 family transposase [Tepidibacter mesophilus]
MKYNDSDNQLNEDTKLIISKMEKELKSKDKEIDTLKKRLAFLENQVLNKNRKIFGSSSEQMDSAQLSIFNEPEKLHDPKMGEPELEEVVYVRAKPSKNTGKKDNLSNLEKVTIEHKLKEGQDSCNECGNPLKIIGKKSKEILKYIPAKLYIEEHITYSYACRSCDDLKTNIITASAPKTLLRKSMASNDILSHVISLKYQYALPLYRQETYFKMLGANLSRQTLSNWIMSVSNELLCVFDLMKEQLIKSNYIQADETTLKVIHDKGKESKSKKYMWLYKTAGDNKKIVLYDYQNTRSSSCPKKFLKNFSGCLQTDGYDGYNKVENIKRLYCLAHIRRKYYEIIVNLNEEALKKSRGVIGFNLCEKIYKLEKSIREKYSEAEDYYKLRYDIRLEKLKPLLEEFKEYVDIEIKDALPKSPLGKALEYSKKLLPKMETILEDGSLEIDNNGAERAIKPFVIGRKNWLFSNTSKGAMASALIYSIIETAKANDLVVEKYLLYLMNEISKLEDIERTKENLLELMPWSNMLPEELKIEKKK